MTKVILNRDYYHLHMEIWNWCKSQFGPAWILNEAANCFEHGAWQMSEAFGHQHYTFDREEDAVLFTLKWVGSSTTVDN